MGVGNSQLSSFSFHLPSDLIAQHPPAIRGASRLLVVDRRTGTFADRQFSDLSTLLQPGDLLVTNDSRVFPARLLGRRLGGGAAECLLVRRIDPASGPSVSREEWEALVHPGQRLAEGSGIDFSREGDVLHAEVLARRFHGRRLVRLTTAGSPVAELVDRLGHIPLPPYIKRADDSVDSERYQTVYASERGSIAAPTAGLHFTEAILTELDARGVERVNVTLHVGYGTFQPIRVDDLDAHEMSSEDFTISSATADVLNRAVAERRRIIAVGTTTTRALESLRVDDRGRIAAFQGSTNLFIRPGHEFRLVSGLITNFHLPQSSLLVLVSAFAGRELVLSAYRHAVDGRYRFYSYGDAMLLV